MTESFVKQKGIVLLPHFYTKAQVDKWIIGLKESLGGIKLLANKKMLWREGPPGFKIVYATDQGWRVAWKPYEEETQEQMDAWARTLPLTLADSVAAGAIDLRG